MARSFDSRNQPGGPRYGAGPKRPLRGIDRAGHLGRVLPGDEKENTRDHERLWMRLHDIQRKADKAQQDISSIIYDGAAAPSGFGVPDGFSWSPRFDGASNVSITGPITINNNQNVKLNSNTDWIVPVGRIRANYDAGYCLQMQWNAQGSAIYGYKFWIRVVGTTTWYALNAYGVIPTSPSPAWAGPVATGYNWDGSSWESPRLYYPGTGSFASAYSSVMEDEFEMCISFGNNSGFSDGTINACNWSVGWVAQSQVPESVYSLPSTTTADSVPVWDTATNSWVASTSLNANARVGVRVNSTGTPTKRRTINFIPGSSKLSVAIADDSVNEEVDTTLDVVPANIPISGLLFSGSADYYLDGTGAYVRLVSRLNGVLYGTPVAGTTRYLAVPRGPLDADLTFDLERLHIRTETPSSSGDVVARLQKSASGGAPSWTDIGTITLTAGSYEADMTIGAYTVTSDDLLRLYFTSIGTGCTDYQALITGTKQ